jgi:programmed cell death protein 5
MVKPEKAAQIEDMLLQMMQQGQLKQKVSEETLKNLLDQVNGAESKKVKITVQRKGRDDESEEEDYSYLE